MQKILSLISSAFLVIMILGVLHSSRDVMGAKKVLAQENIPNGPPCPHFLVQDGDDADIEPDHVPTVPLESECRLQRDVIGLVEPLTLESGMKLNCQGHKITPAVEGILGDANSRSLSELAIFINGSDTVNGIHNVLIQNCIIEEFDHGILAVNSKVPAELKNDPVALAQLRNRIQNNTIKARFVPIHAVSFDNLWVTDNDITWLTRGGAGILVHHDSDANAVKNNNITGDFNSTTQGAVLMPGPTPLSPCPMGNCLNTNPIFNGGHGAVVIVQTLGPHPRLFDAIIKDVVYQFPLSNSSEPDETFTEDNHAEGNTISFPRSGDEGIVFANSRRTRILGNSIQGASGGAIRDGNVYNFSIQFHGNCSLDSGRLCLDNADCNIPGIDMESKGTCSLTPQESVFWITDGGLIEDNIILSPFDIGLGCIGKDLTVRNNTLIGPTRTASGVGIRLAAKNTLETAIVTGNTVSNVPIAVQLIYISPGLAGLVPSFFGAEVSLNDFTGYTIAVGTSNDYILPSDLSVDGRGNYWGLTCAEGGFDPSKVLRVNGTVNPNVVDSYPYGVPVANTLEEDLPATCL